MQEFLLVNPSGPPRKAVLLVEPDEQKSVEKPQQNNEPKNHDENTPKQSSENRQNKQAPDQKRRDEHAQKQASEQHQDKQAQTANNDQKRHDEHAQKQTSVQRQEVRQEVQAQATNKEQTNHDEHSQTKSTVQRQEVQDQVANKDQRHGDDNTTKNLADQRKAIQAQVSAQPPGQTNIPGQLNQQFPVQIPANMNSMQFGQQFGIPSTNQSLDSNAFAALQAQAIAQREALQDISQITSTQQPLQMPSNFIGVTSQQQPAAPDFSAQVPIPTANPVTTLSNDVLQANMLAAGGGSVPFNATGGDSEPRGIVLNEFGPSTMEMD
ncbi:17562_t:CDS:1 [Funneliformis caledonium]|jgi:hypothetical protein|uniref:17562_t:CDS:1 n=1 Tax=Funneliformis caledonium TaxID=1117310 RepID=A0A9N8VG94_9GLOM|nr:17562_t:CDS:1 [Funneliformis caledonium]